MIKNLIAFITIIFLMLILIFEPGLEKPKIKKYSKLTNFNINKIENIEIKSINKNIKFVKQQKLWFMQKPYNLLANQFQIKQLLQLLNIPSYSNWQTNTNNLTNFGLSPAKIELTLNQHKLFFGNLTELQQNRYVLNKNIINIIDNQYFAILDMQITDYISLYPIANNKITEIETPYYHIKSNPAIILNENNKDISTDSIQKIFDNWQQAQALILSIYHEKEKHELNEKIIIHLANNKIMTLYITSRKPSFDLVNLETGIKYYFLKDKASELLSLN
jgi:hypothetical protein